MIRRNAAIGAMMVIAPAVLSLPFKDWSATIRPQDGSTVSGTATASPQSGDSLMVVIRIKGATAGDTHPWHVHAGGCDSSGAILGEAGRYVPVSVGTDQAGEATAKVKVTLTVGVPYSVNVHRSPSATAVIACGNLRPVAGY
jgi:hypothetical protein